MKCTSEGGCGPEVNNLHCGFPNCAWGKRARAEASSCSTPPIPGASNTEDGKRSYNTCGSEDEALTDGLIYMVYRLEYQGSSCIFRTPGALTLTLPEDLDALTPGETMTISTILMTAEELEALPEFEGW
jgi:hypothetical protein